MQSKGASCNQKGPGVPVTGLSVALMGTSVPLIDPLFPIQGPLNCLMVGRGPQFLIRLHRSEGYL